MNINITDNYQEMSQKAAQLIAQEMIKKPELVLGLATGSTPEGLYEHLIELQEEGLIDFSKVITFNLDEYLGLEGNHPQSYRAFMKEKLFDHVPIDPKNTHLLNGACGDVHKEIEAYEALMEKSGGIDIQVLGIGVNGHIGFNEPGTPFDQTTELVDLTPETIEANARFFEREEDVPKQAISMGIKNIMKARKIILLANGKNKAKAIKEAIYGPITPDLPASVLQLHPDVEVILDKEAAKELPCLDS